MDKNREGELGLASEPNYQKKLPSPAESPTTSLPVLSVTKQETKVRGKMVRRQKAKKLGGTINHLLG